MDPGFEIDGWDSRLTAALKKILDAGIEVTLNREKCEFAKFRILYSWAAMVLLPGSSQSLSAFTASINVCVSMGVSNPGYVVYGISDSLDL